jgi:hypothetical protein
MNILVAIAVAGDIKKPKFGSKILSEVYLILPLHINRCIAKKFPIEILLERIDSGVKIHGEFEYDKQNCLQHQKTTARSKN